MSKRVWQYPEVTSIAADDYLLLDNETDGSKSILASKVGAILINKVVTERKVYKASEETGVVNGYKEVSVEVPYTTITDLEGDVVTFEDGEDFPMPSLKVGIEPQQDLHGYDSPWAGGAGKNKSEKKITEFRYAPNANGSATVSGDILTVTTTSSNNSGVYSILDFVESFTGKCSYSVDVKANTNGDVLIGMTNAGKKTVSLTTNWQRVKFEDVTFDGDSKTFVIYSQGTANTIQLKDFMFETGSTAHDYEPYSNICPISGWDECNVGVVGKNLVESTLANTTININGEINVSGGSSTFDMHIAKIIKGETYTIQSDEAQNVNQKFVGGFFYDMPQLGSISYNNSRLANTPATFTAPIDGYVAFRTSHNYAFAQIEFGTTATTYEPYNGQTITIDLDGTRYGGKLDVVSGVLTVTHGIKVYSGNSSEGWYTDGTQSGSTYRMKASDVPSNIKLPPSNADAMSAISNQFIATSADNIFLGNDGIGIPTNGSYLTLYSSVYNTNDVSIWKTHLASNPMQVVYELATPTTIQLTPTAVKSLLGSNNVWADCGKSLVSYQKTWTPPDFTPEN